VAVAGSVRRCRKARRPGWRATEWATARVPAAGDAGSTWGQRHTTSPTPTPTASPTRTTTSNVTMSSSNVCRIGPWVNIQIVPRPTGALEPHDKGWPESVGRRWEGHHRLVPAMIVLVVGYAVLTIAFLALGLLLDHV